MKTKELMDFLQKELARCKDYAEEFNNPDEVVWIEKCIALVKAALEEK